MSEKISMEKVKGGYEVKLRGKTILKGKSRFKEAMEKFVKRNNKLLKRKGD